MKSNLIRTFMSVHFQLIGAFFLLLSSGSCHSESSKIDWEVLNRFPVFSAEEDFQRLVSAWPKNQGAKAFLSKNNEKELRVLLPIDRTAWVPQLGTYDQRVLFRSDNRVRLMWHGQGDCHWKLGEKELTALCGSSVVFPVKLNEKISVSVSDDAGESVSEVIEIKPKLIVAMGDSFASGEGSPDYAAVWRDARIGGNWFLKGRNSKGTLISSARWWDDSCHRSLISWPALFALQEAISNRRGVIQFASFACSGAEVIDGFYLAQQNPPGYYQDFWRGDVPQPENQVRKSYVRNGHGRDGTPGDYVRLSQINALVSLLCQGQVIQGERQFPYEGESIRVDECTKNNLRKVDLLLLAFGGNDVHFASVVKHSIFPDSVRSGLLKKLRGEALQLARWFAEMKSPTEAAESIDLLEGLYGMMDEDLRKLNVSSSKVNALVYPDPLPTIQTDQCTDRIRSGNMALTTLVGKFGSNNMKFGLNKGSVEDVRSNFIFKLRNKQMSLFSPEMLKWQGVPAQIGFDGDAVRTWCAVTPDCYAGQCDVTNLFAWKDGWRDDLGYLNNTKYWSGYSPGRGRGMRTANDAMLIGARQPMNHNYEWVLGTAHPTETVHAGIAEWLSLKYHKALCVDALCNDQIISKAPKADDAI
ncbi:hypothetical protein [Jeongeupia chitinilytica]|uniref:SGNH hydrolase-type esterase domain-containing protein n=1 Tax=Jeongeupia chitinilytica TaxID=1041641 RepID=A0ABQ3GYD8_9NEIS|nr:hypothetical protein [Jeongeupia chitinilytica]GHD59760.1 hypothetical protein GCM10007350_11450 [Jeongeupia chitinilytica]